MEEFSFALAVVLTPAVVGREALRLLHQNQDAAGGHVSLLHLFLPSLVGMVFSFVAGLFALKWLSRWLESAPDTDIDLWVARIPFDETRAYVAHVAQNLARYQWLEGGDDAVTELSLTVPTDARAPADAY